MPQSRIDHHVATRLPARLVVLTASIAWTLQAWAFALLLDRETTVGGMRTPDPYYWSKCVVANLNGGNCNLAITFNTRKPLNAGGQQALGRAVATWNAKAQVANPAGQNNLGTMAQGDPVQNFDRRNYDLETTMLHELGHTFGLDHPEMGRDRTDAANTPLALARTRYTATTDGGGPGAAFDFNAGADGIPGTSDDVRGNDLSVNLTAATNNPFGAPAGVVDSTTFHYAWPGVGFSQTATREVARAIFNNVNLGLEAVMVQDLKEGETRRTLTNDDVDGLRYLQSGRDQRAGTADDYNYVFTYNGAGAAGNADNAPPAGIDVLVTDLPGIRPSAQPVVFDRTQYFAGFISELLYGFRSESDLRSGTTTPDVLGRTDLWLDGMGNIAFADVYVVTHAAGEPPAVWMTSLGVGLAGLVRLRRRRHR